MLVQSTTLLLSKTGRKSKVVEFWLKPTISRKLFKNLYVLLQLLLIFISFAITKVIEKWR